jgi:hypothetical protein
MTMARLALAVALVAAAIVVAWLWQRRAGIGERAPTFHVPEHLDRPDFDRASAAWIVVVFTSASCDTCADVVQKARALESEAVAVQDVEARAHKSLHGRYGVDAVPLTVIADRAGAVRAHFFGPVPAGDLWAALAELRDADPDPDSGPPE